MHWDEKEWYALMLYMMCYVWQVEAFRHKTICFWLLACAHPVSQNCFLFVCFVSKNISFCHYGSLDFLLQFFCLQILWSSVLKRGSLKVVNREGNQMEFSKSKCFAELEVDFLQALCLRTWWAWAAFVRLQPLLKVMRSLWMQHWRVLIICHPVYLVRK